MNNFTRNFILDQQLSNLVLYDGAKRNPEEICMTPANALRTLGGDIRTAVLMLVRNVLVFSGFVYIFAMPAAAQDFSQVPGTVIGHRAGSTNQYLSSPSIAILPNGNYVASHDLFGSGFDEETLGLTTVYRSTDKGETWTQAAAVSGMHFSTLFVYQNDLYLLGSSSAGGNLVINKSTDGGASWTTPTNASTGLLSQGVYGGTSHNPVVYNGRIWAMTHTQASPQAISAQIGSDLLNAASWTFSNSIPKDSSWLDGYPYADFQRWTEAQPIASPDLGVIYMPKIHDATYSALIRANTTTGDVSFDPGNDFVYMPGAEKKFGIHYDSVTQRYWAASNPVLPEHEGDDPDIGGDTRNTAAILSSPDLRDWKLESVFLYNTDSHDHAFQYLNYEVDGDDLAVVSRTAFEDGLGGADSWHNNNLMTFHRVEDFRTLSPTHVLVAETGNNRVVRYQTMQGMPWAPLEDFAQGSYAGAALDKPFGLAHDVEGNVYIGEEKDGGRILRFDAAGNFLDIVATEGLDFIGKPEDLVAGPDGSIYMSVSFGTNSDKIYKIDTDSDQVDLLIDTTFDGGLRSFNDPRGIAFDDLGYLYVADRNGTDDGNADHNLVRKFDAETGAFLGNLIVIDRPQALGWDDANSRLLLAADDAQSDTDILAVSLAGLSSSLYTTQTDLAGVLDVDVIDGDVVWIDYDNGRVDRLVSTDVREPVITGLTAPGHFLEVERTHLRTWTSSTGGRWRDGQHWNWIWGVANEADEVAVFNGTNAGSINIELIDVTTVGGIRYYGSASHNIMGTGSLGIDAQATDKQIAVRAGQHAIQVPLSLPGGVTIDIAQTSSLTVSNNVTVEADSLVFTGGGEFILSANLSIVVPGGQGFVVADDSTLTGSGLILGNLTNQSGIVAPGNSPGSIGLTGDYQQYDEATLLIELGGTDPGMFDRLLIGGDVILDGTLVIELIDGFTPNLGDSFPIILGSTITGAFDTLVGDPGGGLSYEVSYLATSVLLSVIDPLAIPGDLDGDGFVGITDLNIVLGNWNLSVPPGNLLADPSGDGFVGIEDLNVVLGNWNAGTPPSSNNIPEPSTLVMLSLPGVALLYRNRKGVI
jgi:hypothetical protein